MKKIVNMVTALILLNISTQASTIKNVTLVKKDVVFEVTFDTAVKEAPILRIFEKGMISSDASNEGQKDIQAKRSKSNSFIFELKKQDRPLYFALVLPDKLMEIHVIRGYHFEPGDHIKIHVKQTGIPNIYDLEFSGKGSAKYRCKNEFKDAVRIMNDSNKALDYNKNINRKFRSLDAVRRLIDKYQPQMSDYSYHLLNADVIGGYGKDILVSVNKDLTKLLNNKDTVGFRQLIDQFSREMKFDFTSGIPDTILRDSKDYSEFMLDNIRYKNLLSSGRTDFFSMYQDVKKISSSALRDKMIMNFMMMYSMIINGHYTEILNDAISTVKDPYCLKRIKALESNIAGNKAFDFSLKDRNGKMVNMHDFIGKVVFIDFWFTGCIHCEHYYKGHLSHVEEFYANNPEVVFITVSIDKDKEEWLQSVDSGKYTSAKAINLYTNGEGLNNGIIKYYNITSYPRPMLISRQGNIIKFTGNELRDKVILKREIEDALKTSR